MDSGALIFRTKSFSPELTVAVTRILKFDVPAVVGVPLMTPAVDSDRPAGSEPVKTDHVRVPVPPVPARV